MEVKPIARDYLGLTLSLDILKIEYGINDYVYCKFSDEEKIHRLKIQVSKKGDSYFILNNVRYYLAEFIRS